MTSRSKVGTPAQRRERERKARFALIRKAGTQVFARYGFEQATMAQVARHAELGKASLYYYYKTKQELFADIVHHAMRTMTEGLAGELAPYQEAMEAARGALTRAQALEVLELVCRFSLKHFWAHKETVAIVLPLMGSNGERLERLVGPEIMGEVRSAHMPMFRLLEPLSREFPKGSQMVNLLASLLLGLATKVMHDSELDLDAELELFLFIIRRAWKDETEAEES